MRIINTATCEQKERIFSHNYSIGRKGESFKYAWRRDNIDAMPSSSKEEKQIADVLHYLADQRDEPGHLERLFCAYREIALKKNQMHPSRLDSDDDSVYLKNAEKLIVNVAMCVQSLSERDVLLKLALWRWSMPHLAGSLNTMKPSDALAYSAFRDFAAFLGDTSVGTELDNKTDFLRYPDRA